MVNNVNLKNVNKAIKGFGVKLVKGNGYYYFVSIHKSYTLTAYSTSVNVYRITDLSMEDWLHEACELAETLEPINN